MAEAGGPATQSGIFFQNTIASRYLARLIDPAERPASEDVTRVRVEAPGSVDDIVVSYRDGHQEWISAKERLDPSSGEFVAVWRAFVQQSAEAIFGPADRLRLTIGAVHEVHETILNLTERASTSTSNEEWRARLGKKHLTALDKIRTAIDATSDEALFRLLARVDIEITSLALIESQIPFWIPVASIAKHTLWRLLRDRVGGHARLRRIFEREALVRELREHDSVQIIDLQSAEAVYSQALLRRYERIVVPGTAISGEAEKLYQEPLLRILPATRPTSTATSVAFHEQEIYEREGERVGLGALDEISNCIVVAPAGFGKTELVRTLARRYVRAGLVPAVVPLVDADERALPVLTYLESSVNETFACNVDWRGTSEQGRVVLLLDGLDELADHPRAVALKRLTDFSSRFPGVRWIVTVRDESALTSFPDATILALEPWHDERRVALVTAFFGDESDNRAQSLCTRLSHSIELDRLARVPLFLALLVEESQDAQFDLRQLRRTDLLLHYVNRLVGTEVDAEKRPSENTRRTLLGAAEHIALAALEVGTAEITEDAVLLILEKHAIASPEAVLRDLVASGLLRVGRHRVRFVFPLVQEYLAGRKLERTETPDTLAHRFRRAASRPWAQAMRFAFESSTSADEIANALLAQPDDAFNSVVIAVGQCVADGARLSPKNHEELGERLGTLWAESRFSQHTALTKVLAAGFSCPLPESARTAIEGERRLDQGGDELLSAACDDQLSRAVLRRRPLPFGFRLGSAKKAMSRISDDVASAYVEWFQRSDDRQKTVIDAGQAGCIIRDLDGLSPQLQRQIADDQGLPALVRIGALLLRPDHLQLDHITLVECALHDVLVDTHPTRSFFFELAEEALWRLPPAEAENTWMRAILDETYLAQGRVLLLSGMTRYRAAPEALALVDRIDARESIFLATEVVKAWLGRREVMVELSDMVEQLDEDGLRWWGILISKYRERDLVVRGLERVLAQPWASAQVHELAHMFWFRLANEVDGPDPLGGSSGRYRRHHPAAPDAAMLFQRFAGKIDNTEGARVLCLMISLDLGNETARAELLGELSKVRGHAVTWKEGYALGHAVTVLARRDPLPSDLMRTLPRESNLFNALCRACARHPSREALEFLLGEYRRVRAVNHERDQVLAALKTVSLAIGIRLEERSGYLVEV